MFPFLIIRFNRHKITLANYVKFITYTLNFCTYIIIDELVHWSLLVPNPYLEWHW